MNQLCKVCGEPAAGFHFGAFTCEGCKSFFGRTYNNVSGVSECKNGGRCEINKKNRTSCKSCRLRKCLQVGMSKSGSRYGRRSNWFKIHCLLSAQTAQQNGGSPGSNMPSLPSNQPEANNNNTNATNHNNTTTNLNSNHHNHSKHNHHSTGSILSSSSHSPPTGSLTLQNNDGLGIGRRSPKNRSTLQISQQNPTNTDTSKDFSYLSNINRKMLTPELFDYFRAANIPIPPLNGLINNNGSGTISNLSGIGSNPSKTFLSNSTSTDSKIINGGFPLGDDCRSRTSQSPSSLESPNSDRSSSIIDESTTVKGLHTFPGLFGSTPGSPSDIKSSNDFLSFDLLTRDLMKLGYDPLRFWPAMLGSSTPGTNPAAAVFSQFSPYRFIFPNFPTVPQSSTPNSQTTTAPGTFPNSPGNPIFPTNGFLGGSLSIPPGTTTSNVPVSLFPPAASKLLSTMTSPNAMSGSSTSTNIDSTLIGGSSSTQRRFPLVTIPPASSLTLTPPISHHGSDEASNLSISKKLQEISSQDQPIDLSAKATNERGPTSNRRNLRIGSHYHKNHSRSQSEDDSEEDLTGSDAGHNELRSNDECENDRSSVTIKTEIIQENDSLSENELSHSINNRSRKNRRKLKKKENRLFINSSISKNIVVKSELCTESSTTGQIPLVVKKENDDEREESSCDGDDEEESYNLAKRNQRKRRDSRRSSSSNTSTHSVQSRGSSSSHQTNRISSAKKIKVSIPLDLSSSSANSTAPSIPTTQKIAT